MNKLTGYYPTTQVAIKVCPQEREPRDVVPQGFSKQNLVGLYQASQYYRNAIGLLAWRTKVDSGPWANHRFVVFFGPQNSIKALPSIEDGYPLYLPSTAGAPACTYRAISWCKTKALHDYLYELTLHDEVMDGQGWIPSQES